MRFKSIIKLFFIPCFYFFINYTVMAQKKSGERIEFERKFEQFKYSLYPDLIKLNRQDLQNFNYPSNIIDKINLFLEKNANSISAVQESMLEEFKDVEIDYSSFQEDDNFDKFKNKSVFHMLLMENESIAQSAVIIYQLNLNPLNRIYALVTSLGPRIDNIAAENYAARMITQYMAGVLVKTKLLKKNSWLITFNNYYRIFEFEFNVKTQEITFLKLYRRNT